MTQSINPNAHIYPLCANSYDYINELTASEKYGKLIFDIGANDGGYASGFSKVAEKIIAFEPVPNMFQILSNINNNKIIPVNLGMGIENKTITVNVFNTWSLIPTQEIHKVDKALDYLKTPDFDIQLITLQDAVEAFGEPTFIKLDVDGYEADVIEGGYDFLKEKHPPIMLELSYLGRIFNQAPELPLSLMYELEYVAVSLDKKYICHTFEEAMKHFPFHTSYDVIMIHKSDIL